VGQIRKEKIMCEICEEQRYTLNGTPGYAKNGMPSPVGQYYDQCGSTTPWQADLREDKDPIRQLGRRVEKIRRERRLQGLRQH